MNLHPFSRLINSPWVTKLLVALLVIALNGCNQIRLPRIDPTGNRLFLPGTTPVVNQIRPVPAYQTPPRPFPCPPNYPQHPVGPVRPGLNPLAQGAPVGSGVRPQIMSPAPELTIPRKSGRIIMTPDEVVAPVGSEVVLMTGICGNDGHYVIRQPVEWMLSQESVGNFVTVADGPNQLVSGVFGRNTRKLSTGFAKGVTSASAKRITRGTPTVRDDLYVAKGQAWVSLTSPSEGTSFVTCVAPNANGWDRRRSIAKVHWLDARWQLPQSTTLSNGQTQNLEVRLFRGNGEPIPNWNVVYEIVGGKNAGLLPSGAQKAEITTNSGGVANVGIRQIANGPANAQVRIQVIRPGNPFGSQRRLVVVDSLVNVRWTAPALAIEVAGPKQVGRDADFTYRINVRNPGDAVARNAVVRMTGLDPKLEIISTSPNGKVIGGQIEWNLGDVAPNKVPYSIDLKLKAFRAGKTSTCFSVESAVDRLGPINACIESNVSVPCIGLKINGPTEAQVGETLTYRLRIENQCEQPISGIRLIANYPEGLEFPGETSPIEQALTEQINFGFYKELEISFVAKKSGRQCFTIDVNSSDGSKARIEQCVQVSQEPSPSASIAINGPALGSVGEIKRYEIDVKNNGNVALTDVEVAIAFDRSFIPQQAQNGFQQRGEDEMFWVIPRLDPGDIKQFAVDHQLVRENDNALNIVKITSREGVNERDQTRTVIRSAERQLNPPNANLSNSLKLNGVVLTNPVNPNDNAEFTVELLNDRPPQDFENNVLLTIRVPSNLEFVSGPANLNIRNQVVGNETIYQVGPVKALRGSRPQTLKFSFKPLQADGKYRVVIQAESDRSKPVEKTLEINVTR